MRRSRSDGFLLGLIFSFQIYAVQSLAAPVYVGALKGTAVDANDVLAVEELIKSSVVEAQGHQLAASAQEADYVISGHLVRLGDAYALTLVKTKGSRELHRATLKSAMMSDMDVVVRRLVRSIDQETTVEKSATIKDVTLDEEKNQRRRKEVVSQKVFSVGPATAPSLNVSGPLTLWNLGYNYEIDPDWDMHWGLDWLSTHRKSEDDAYYLAANFGLNHYLSDQNASPFILGSIGYGWASASRGCDGGTLICSSKDKAAGWLGSVGLGYRFFRTSKSNFSILMRASWMGSSTDVTKKYPAVGSLMLVGYF